jgi:hypothetical protein
MLELKLGDGRVDNAISPHIAAGDEIVGGIDALASASRSSALERNSWLRRNRA